jgi:hypothetical protein
MSAEGTPAGAHKPVRRCRSTLTVRTLADVARETDFCRWRAEELVALGAFADDLVMKNADSPDADPEVLLTAITGILRDKAQELVTDLEVIHKGAAALAWPARQAEASS